MFRAINFFNSQEKKRSFIYLYSLVFIVLSFLVFFWFFISGKSFIFNGDGFNQHFKALIYYSKYLRGILFTLIKEHKLVIPQYDFYIGEGSDILNTFHYYVIGDPISILSVFCPQKYIVYFYNLSILLRVYLSGLAFIIFSFSMGNKNRYAIMAAALSYSFSGWALFASVRHPYFMNPMIYFPFIILGIEKIIRKENPYIFILAVTISALSNFYFLYIIAMLSVFYTLFRLIFLYKENIKKIVYVLLKIGGFAFLGIILSSVILLPMLMFFLNDSRGGIDNSVPLFYPVFFYTQFPAMLISVQKNFYWTFIGTSGLSVLSVLLLFFEKNKNSFLKFISVVCVVFLVFPFFGSFLNGMSYVTNRWIWVLSFLFNYILVIKWENLLTLKNKKFFILLCFSFLMYISCTILEGSRNLSAISQVSILFFSLSFLHSQVLGDKKRVKEVILIFLVIVNIIGNAFWYYSPFGNNYISGFYEMSDVWDIYNERPTRFIDDLSSLTYNRISMKVNRESENTNIFDNVSSTQYYWTLSNPSLNKYRDSLCVNENTLYHFTEYDKRASLLSLSSVNFYCIEKGRDDKAPYGFEKYKEIGNYDFYLNKYALPFGYCYDSFYTKKTWDSFNPVQKQQAQLHSAYIENEKNEENNSLELPSYKVPYKLVEYGARFVPLPALNVVPSKSL